MFMDVVCLQIMLFDSGILRTTLTWKLSTLVSTQMPKKARADFGFELKGGAKISGGVQIFGTFHPLSGALF